MNTQRTSDFLIEIGCEELPAKSLYAIEQAFNTMMADALGAEGLSFKSVRAFSTPRRLALHFKALTTHQASSLGSKQGPTKALALDAQGQWTPAALGFAAACGIEAKDLSFEATDKGERLVYSHTIEGKSLDALLPPLLTKVLMELPVGKRMRLAHGGSFSRPIRWVLLLMDDQVLECEIVGIRSDRLSYGHRFHHPESIKIPHARDYEALLKQHDVIPCFVERRTWISDQLQEQAKQQQASAIVPELLLDEVTGLVEWPVVLLGTFKKDFLKLPAEVLTSTINTHQKSFALSHKNNPLLANFLTVSNIKSKDPHTVIAGNECVIDARLMDAAFYYESDRKKPLAHYREDLKQVRFQEGLGTLFDKTERMAKLASYTGLPRCARNDEGSRAGTVTGPYNDADARKLGDPHDGNCQKAAKLCKSDLLSQMVGEFPELQGVMGRYYALAEGIDPVVAQAIEEHYYPRFAKDTLPSSMEGAMLAIADRVDTLVGLFGIGKIPTGSKDPFSLRRQALGLIRVLIENKIPLDLRDLCQHAVFLYPPNTFVKNTAPVGKAPSLENTPSSVIASAARQSRGENPFINELLIFCMERLKSYLQEHGIGQNIFEAVANLDPTKQGLSITNPLDFYDRCLALRDFLSHPEAPVLIAANKRVKNILKDYSISVEDPNFAHLLKEPAEKNLLACLETVDRALVSVLQSKPDYAKALGSLLILAKPLDQFFESVMVMCEDPALRSSRLTLLHRLRLLFLQIADFSFL